MDYSCHTCKQATRAYKCSKCNSDLCTACVMNHSCACIHCKDKDFPGPLCDLRSLCTHCIPFSQITELFVIYEGKESESPETTVEFLRSILDVRVGVTIIRKNKDKSQLVASFSETIMTEHSYKSFLILANESYRIIPKIVNILQQNLDVEVLIGDTKLENIHKIVYTNFSHSNPITDELRMFAKDGIVLVKENDLGMTVSSSEKKEYLEAAGKKHIFKGHFGEKSYFSLAFDNLDISAIEYAVLALERSSIVPFVSRVKDILRHVFNLDVNIPEIFHIARSSLTVYRTKHINGKYRDAIQINKSLKEPSMDRIIEKMFNHYRNNIKRLSSAELKGIFLNTYFLVYFPNTHEDNIFYFDFYYMIEKEKCRYCLEKKNEKFFRLYECTHIFHYSCIIECVNIDRDNQITPSCPNCRVLTQHEIIKIDNLFSKNIPTEYIPRSQPITQGFEPVQDDYRINTQIPRDDIEKLQPHTRNLYHFQPSHSHYRYNSNYSDEQTKTQTSNLIQCQNCLYSSDISRQDHFEYCHKCNDNSCFKCIKCSQELCLSGCD